MPKPGNYAAYQQSTPISEDFGANAIQAENQQFKYRAEKRQEEAIAYQKQKDQDAAMDADYSKMKAVITGVKDLDQANTLFYERGMEQLGDIHRQLDNPQLTKDQRRELIYKKNMITKAPELMASVADKMTKWVDATTKGIQEGTVSGWDMYELDTAKSHYDMRGEKGAVFGYDEQGRPVGKVLREDGELVDVNYTDIVQGFKFGDNTSRIDKASWTKSRVENLGKQQQVAYRKGLVGVEQTFDNHRDYVQKSVAADLGTAEDPSDLAKSIWADTMGRSPKDFDENSIKEIHQMLTQEVEAAYDETFSGSQVRPASTGTKKTFSDRKVEKAASALYKTAQGIVNLDPEYLRGVSSQNTTIGGEKIALGTPQYLEGTNELVIVDKDNTEVQRVSLNDKEAAAREIAKIISGKEAVSEVVGDYELGRDLVEQDGGLTLSGKRVEGTEEVEETTLDRDAFNRLENQGEAAPLVKTLMKMFGDTEFTFKPKTSIWHNDKVTIFGGGVGKEIDLGDKDNPNPNAIKEIQEFMESKAPKKKVYKTPEKKKDSNKSNSFKVAPPEGKFN